MTVSRSLIVLPILLAVAIHPARAADARVFPGPAWEELTPEAQAVDSARLRAAAEYLRQAAGKDGVKRMVIVRNGRIIWRGPESSTCQRVWSVTKAFTSTAHGLLIEDGKCTLDTLAKDYDPALQRQYPNVTLRHFATMTSDWTASAAPTISTPESAEIRTPWSSPCRRSSRRARNTCIGTRPPSITGMP